MVLWLHIGIHMHLLAVEPRSTARLLSPSQCLSGMILLTLCSMVSAYRVSRAGQMSSYWPAARFISCLLLFSPSLFSFYGLVLWGWGLRTDRALIALSQLCIAGLFLIIYIFYIYKKYIIYIVVAAATAAKFSRQYCSLSSV